MHGKSVVDGGTLKRYVRERIIAQELQVKSAKDFVAASEGLAIEVILMSSKDIEKRNKEIKLTSIIKESRQIAEI